MEILVSRVAEVQALDATKQAESVFKPQSLQFVAMKIGNYSGDIRRVLMITKRAVEICKETYQTKVDKASKGEKVPLVQVNEGTLNQAFNELYKSKTVQVLR